MNMPNPESLRRTTVALGQGLDEETIPPLFDPARIALFLDLDGTLADICAEPSQVVVPDATLAILARLQQTLDGALAVLSGRSGQMIDQLLDPLRLPYGANHGAECRWGDDTACRVDPPSGLVDAVAALRRATAGWRGVLVEPKPLGVAVHFRLAEHRGIAVHQCVRAVAAAHAGQFDLIRGKMVYELKPRGVDKGSALREFLRHPPFTGRLPVMVGDDLTDESAFVAAREAGGGGIKIGQGNSAAVWRLSTPADLARWLYALNTKGES